ncbi:MAG: hypothetical protein KDK59_02510 [Simkania sp.]|nr:hypothetical protein [Simkania sp.]MCP5489537.1 hypothetical protein [Chlamydiales bacterium]
MYGMGYQKTLKGIENPPEFDEAIDLSSQSLEIKESIDGLNPLSIALTLTNRGYAYFAKKCFAESFNDHLRALEIRMQHLKEGHPDLELTNNNLLLMLKEQDVDASRYFNIRYQDKPRQERQKLQCEYMYIQQEQKQEVQVSSSEEEQQRAKFQSLQQQQ